MRRAVCRPHAVCRKRSRSSRSWGLTSLSMGNGFTAQTSSSTTVEILGHLFQQIIFDYFAKTMQQYFVES